MDEEAIMEREKVSHDDALSFLRSLELYYEQRTARNDHSGRKRGKDDEENTFKASQVFSSEEYPSLFLNKNNMSIIISTFREIRS